MNVLKLDYQLFTIRVQYLYTYIVQDQTKTKTKSRPVRHRMRDQRALLKIKHYMSSLKRKQTLAHFLALV